MLLLVGFSLDNILEEADDVLKSNGAIQWRYDLFSVRWTHCAIFFATAQYHQPSILSDIAN